MVGSMINAFSSLHKANKANKDIKEYERRQRELDAGRPQYNADAVSSQSVNPLYDQNITLLNLTSHTLR